MARVDDVRRITAEALGVDLGEVDYITEELLDQDATAEPFAPDLADLEEQSAAHLAMMLEDDDVRDDVSSSTPLILERPGYVAGFFTGNRITFDDKGMASFDSGYQDAWCGREFRRTVDASNGWTQMRGSRCGHYIAAWILYWVRDTRVPGWGV